MNMPTLAFVLVTTSCGQMTEEFQHHFRESVFDHPDLKLIGPNVSQYTKPEPGGLRVSWTAQEGTNSPIGIGSKLSLRGDFEITARYELLNVDPVKVGYGAGVRLYLKLSSTPAEALSMGRVVLGEPPKDLYVVNHVKSPSQKGEKDKLFRKGFPAPSKTGQLRIIRKGKVLSYHVADRDEAEFRELASTPSATDDVIEMSFTGWTGGVGKGAVDVRLVDLKIRADDMPNRSQSAPVTPPPRQESTSWWLVIVALGIVLLVGLGVGFWLWSRRGREEDEEEDEDQEEE